MKKSSKEKEKESEGVSIREVWADNFVEEIKKLSSYLDKYTYVAMDTEFPGVVYQSNMTSREAYYRTIKTNVDNLKLIQVGVTLSDEKGERPPEGATWQFNLKFNLNTDQFSHESIALLTNSGINFEMLESRGIPHEVFGECMISSGLVLNEDVHWISFHGIYDFAYFLKIVTNLPLPETESAFFDTLGLYFANYYDIRYLVRYNDSFRGSLAKLGQELNVARVGTQHQAGSDSLITSEIFFKLCQDHLSQDSTLNDRNVLHGIGLGLDDSDSGIYYSRPFRTSQNSLNYDYVNFYQMNMQQYNYLRGNSNYYGLNNMNNMSNLNNMSNMSTYYPYNGYGMYQMNMMNSAANLSEETKKKYNLKNLVED